MLNGQTTVTVATPTTTRFLRDEPVSLRLLRSQGFRVKVAQTTDLPSFWFYKELWFEEGTRESRRVVSGRNRLPRGVTFDVLLRERRFISVLDLLVVVDGGGRRRTSRVDAPGTGRRIGSWGVQSPNVALWPVVHLLIRSLMTRKESCTIGLLTCPLPLSPLIWTSLLGFWWVEGVPVDFRYRVLQRNSTVTPTHYLVHVNLSWSKSVSVLRSRPPLVA